MHFKRRHVDQLTNLIHQSDKVTYDGGFSKDHTVVQWFWEVVHELDYRMQVHFLEFCTGCGKVSVVEERMRYFCNSGTGADRRVEELTIQNPTKWAGYRPLANRVDVFQYAVAA